MDQDRVVTVKVRVDTLKGPLFIFHVPISLDGILRSIGVDPRNIRVVDHGLPSDVHVSEVAESVIFVKTEEDGTKL